MAKKALVIGINNYGFPNDLPSCARDADAFANVLESVYRFEHIRVLKDAEATRDGIDRRFEWLFQGAGGNDRLVVYFSGHGCRFEKNGVVEEALVLQDGRLVDDRELADRTESLPPGVLTVVLDCSFTGAFEGMVLHPSGQVEVARLKRWMATDADRGRQDRASTPGLKAFSPFGHLKPAAEAMLAHARGPASLDPMPARVTSLPEPQAKAVLVLPCLGDEAAAAATSQTSGLSAFTFCLINAIRRFGPNRSAIEVLQAAGHELRRLGLQQTPLVKEPLNPEHLALRSFLTFQPVFFVYPPSSTPGQEGEDELTRSIAEAVRNTLITSKEGRSM